MTAGVEIEVRPSARGAGQDLAADVRAGLTAGFKELQPKYFYDEAGSQLFEEITELPEYYPTRAEREILTEQAAAIVAAGDPECLIELGSGSASKTRSLLAAMRDAGSLHTYVPVDISEEITRETAESLVAEFPGLEVHGVICDFERDLERLPCWGQRRMFAFLGGTIGNFPPEQRRLFLRRIAALLGPEDSLLLGTDLVKDRATLEAAYDDSAGVTARFNKNVLVVLNRELGADFDLDAFEHHAFYDDRNERIDIRLRSLRDQLVTIADLELEVRFAAGEEMRTELSCKFTRERLACDYASTGLGLTELWTDSEGRFALSLARPAEVAAARAAAGGSSAVLASSIRAVEEEQGSGRDTATDEGGASSVRFREVSKTYPGASAPAVNGLDLEVPAGEICVFVGPSGCGKTTAMRMVNRTVEISEGDIEIGGRSVRDRRPSELRREIGYVIQQIGLFPHRTIAENIATVPHLLGWEQERTRERARELIELIGLDAEVADRFPSQLSGGQQQRVGVARALAADPPVMLMDEPFGAIDPINRERLQNEFLRLQAEIRKTILFVTHDIDEAIKMGDRIAVLREGGVLAQYATPAELLMAPADGFVEDFVGADRALKRLALMRVSDIDLWEAPLAFAGQATAEVRAKLEGAEVPWALLVDSDRKPLGWLSQSDLQADTVPQTPDMSPNPILEADDVMRDALSDLLQAETHYAPVVDHRGVIAGVLSIEVISDFLASDDAKIEEHGASERPLD